MDGRDPQMPRSASPSGALATCSTHSAGCEDSVDRRPLIRLSHKRKRALAVVASVYRSICRGSLALHAVRLLGFRRGFTVIPSGDPLLSTRIAVEGDPTVRARVGTRHGLHWGTRLPAKRGWIWTSRSVPGRIGTYGAIASAMAAGVARTNCCSSRPRRRDCTGIFEDAVSLRQRAAQPRAGERNADALFARQRQIPGRRLPMHWSDTSPPKRTRISVVPRCGSHCSLQAPNPSLARIRFDAAANCFEAAGDLDGVAQSWYENGVAGLDTGVGTRSLFERAASTAQISGNIEQQVTISAALAEFMKTLATRRPPMSRSARQFRLRTDMI